jgi:hypothetical protein
VESVSQGEIGVSLLWLFLAVVVVASSIWALFRGTECARGKPAACYSSVDPWQGAQVTWKSGLLQEESGIFFWLFWGVFLVALLIRALPRASE